MGLLQPIVQEELELIEKDEAMLLEAKKYEERLSGKQFQGLNVDSEDLSHLIISGVKFINCRFWNCSFERAELTDVILKGCDFSGCNFHGSYLNRIVFDSCKAVGAKFTESRMHHVSICDCSMNYANFDNSILKEFLLENTELNSSNLSQCRCKNIIWKNTGLVNASFFKTSLYGMDLTDCTITGLVLSDDNSELRGLTVDIYQAAELARRLGVIIK